MGQINLLSPMGRTSTQGTYYYWCALKKISDKSTHTAAAMTNNII